MMELKNIQRVCYTVCCHVYTYIVGSEAKLGVVQRAFSTPGPRGVELFADFEIYWIYLVQNLPIVIILHVLQLSDISISYQTSKYG